MKVKNMKNKQSNQNEANNGINQFTTVCLATCKKLLAQIKTVRDAILWEFAETGAAHERLVKLALNEAEALAWETSYPQLMFPTLALEKVQAVSAWSTHQELVRRVNGITARAA